MTAQQPTSRTHLPLTRLAEEQGWSKDTAREDRPCPREPTGAVGTLTQQLCWISLEGCLKEVACKGEGSGYSIGSGSGEHLRSLSRIRARTPEQQSKGTPSLPWLLPCPSPTPCHQGSSAASLRVPS